MNLNELQHGLDMWAVGIGLVLLSFRYTHGEIS